MIDVKHAWLYYGDAGVGKSKMIADALASVGGVVLDYEGRLGHFDLPPECVKDMRPAYGKKEQAVNGLQRFMDKHFKDRAAGRPTPPVIGLDSLTEAQFLIRLGMAAAEADDSSKAVDPEMLSQRGWGKMGDRLAYDVSYLHPTFTGAHFIATAFENTKRGAFGAEDQRIRPSFQGAMGERLQKYFDFVVYVEHKPVRVDGKITPVHRYHFAPFGDFLIKNIYEDREVIPAYIDNPSWTDLQELATKAANMKGDK